MSPHDERHDLSVVIVSMNDARWLDACLSTVYARAGAARLDVVVVDNGCTDGTGDLVRERFSQARVVRCPNRGFAHANNRALMTPMARHVLFLNPDTEVHEGDFGALVDMLDRRPEIGLVGVKQRTGDGALYPTIRRFPSAVRAVGEALASERWPLRGSWVGERNLAMDEYEREQECDWTVGSYMLVRREALRSAGFMDERFFLYSEETDLCLRIRRAGWRIVHSPAMTIVHHAGKAGIDGRLVAQEAYARRIYAAKHFAAAQRLLYLGAVTARYGVRSVAPGGRPRRTASRRALRTLVGLQAPPFGAPPRTSIDPSTVPGP